MDPAAPDVGDLCGLPDVCFRVTDTTNQSPAYIAQRARDKVRECAVRQARHNIRHGVALLRLAHVGHDPAWRAVVDEEGAARLGILNQAAELVGNHSQGRLIRDFGGTEPHAWVRALGPVDLCVATLPVWAWTYKTAGQWGDA